MAEELNYMSTEEEALGEEKREQEWQEIWGKNTQFYIQKINDLLADGTRESRAQIRDMFADQEFFRHYRQVDVFATMYVIMSIYELESAKELSVTILDHADTVAGLMDCMFEFKMILYRFDFAIDQDIETELISFIRKYNVSSCWINIMMTTSVMHPLPVALRLERIFERVGFFDLWFSMLIFLKEHFEGNYRINAKIAGVYRDAGQLELAEDYWKQIPEIPVQLREYEEQIFELQELLWKVRYMVTAAEREIALFMKVQKIIDSVWEFLVEHIEVTDQRYYLRIANALLEADESNMAEIILIQATKIAPGNELIFCLLAELSVNAGNVNLAIAYLSQVENPGELTEKLQKICMAREGE